MVFAILTSKLTASRPLHTAFKRRAASTLQPHRLHIELSISNLKKKP